MHRYVCECLDDINKKKAPNILRRNVIFILCLLQAVPVGWVLNTNNYFVAGCGNHIEKALKDVPPEERCKCEKQEKKCVL